MNENCPELTWSSSPIEMSAFDLNSLKLSQLQVVMEAELEEAKLSRFIWVMLEPIF